MRELDDDLQNRGLDEQQALADALTLIRIMAKH